MPRGLSAPQLAAIQANRVGLAILAELQFVSYTVYVWSGLGPFFYNGNTYTGVGILGKISPIQETNDVVATGMSLTLSSISEADLELPDIQANMSLNNGVTVSLCLLDDSRNLIGGAPITSFQGVMGQCSISEDAKGSSVTIEVETKLAQLNRPKYWRYTLTDINFWNPGDQSFSWTVNLADYTYRFGD